MRLIVNSLFTKYKDLLPKNLIWLNAEKGHFEAVIESLLKARVDEDDVGEIIFGLVDQAILENKFNAAIKLLEFLSDALEDHSELPTIYKKFGDIYSIISEHHKALEYYGKLPATLANTQLCFNTFIPANDIDGLLSLRDKLLCRIPEDKYDQIHAITNNTVNKIAAKPPIFDSHIKQYQKNLDILKAIAPFKGAPYLLDHMWQPSPPNTWQPEILRIQNKVYVKNNNTWIFAFSDDFSNHLNLKKIEDGFNIMVNCSKPESFVIFLKRIQTETPAFIKYECRVIIDFDQLKCFMTVFKMSPINQCNFFIRFIDSNNIDQQLVHLLVERKLPFTNQLIYISNNDHIFFEKNVIPTLKICEKHLRDDEEKYEKALPHIFPDDFQNSVIHKIKSGQKLKVLFFTSRYTTYMQYSVRDIAEGFSQLGHETFIEIEEEDSGVSIRKDVCMANLNNFRPDIIFTINHFRLSYRWVPESIPFVTWIQDLMPHIRNLNDSSLLSGGNNYIFSFSKSFQNFLDQHPSYKNTQINVLPIPINDRVFFPLKKCREKYDVIYVTHMNADLDRYTLKPFREGKPVNGFDSKSDYLFLQKVALALEKMSLTELWDIYRSPQNKKAFASEISHKYSLTLRENQLQYLENFDQNGETLFGKDIVSLMKIKPIELLIKNGIQVKVVGRNWEKIARFKKIVLGCVENGPLLNNLLNESRIILNISPGNSYHMRAADAIAANRFVLSFLGKGDGMPITDFFEKDKEIISFSTDKELIQRIKHYLKDKKERDRIASKAYLRAKSKYTCKITAEKIIKEIEKNRA